MFHFFGKSKQGLRSKIYRFFSDQFAQIWPKSQYEDTEDDELDEEQKRQKAIDAAIKEIMERFAIIAVTQPLHVVVVRAMASFVGKESDYNNVFSGLVSIYRESGKQFSVRNITKLP